MRTFKRSRKSLAQTTVEYAIIIALIAVAAIGAYMALGSSTVNLTKQNVEKMQGNADADRGTVDTSGISGPTLGGGDGL